MMSVVWKPQRTGTFLTVGPAVRSLALGVFLSLFVWWVSKDGRAGHDAVYSNMLGILSIFAGFLATFYVFVATRGNAFLLAIRHTASFRNMIALLRFTLIWTVLVAGITFILAVLQPKDYPLLGVIHGGIFLWAWSVSMIVVNFWRCASMFVSIIEANER